MKDLRKEDEKRYIKKDKIYSLLRDKKIIIFSMLTIVLIFGIVAMITQSIFMDFKRITYWKNRGIDYSQFIDNKGLENEVSAMFKSFGEIAIFSLVFAIGGLVGTLISWIQVLKTKQFTSRTSLLLNISFVIILISMISNIPSNYTGFLVKQKATQAELDAAPGTIRAAFNLFQVNVTFIVISTIPYVSFRIIEKFK